MSKTAIRITISLFLVLFSLKPGLFAAPPSTKSTLVTYPKPDGLQTSANFTVRVNNSPVWTEQIGSGGMENLHVANFSCSGPQAITVVASSKISKYKIGPASRAIQAKVNGRELNFTISGPQKLYIEIDGLPALAIFANPLETHIPKNGDPGVLYFGAGTHNEGEINLKSGQTVYIAGGAVVNANVRGKNLKNVKIEGRGILNGNVRIYGSSNIDVSGVFIRNTSNWSNTLIDCEHTVYNNVKVFSYKGVWGIDGIDPVSCKDFKINYCFIRTRDDCISIKSMGRFGSDTVKNINTDSITVTNCLLVGWAHADGVTLGFELQGGLVQNVLVKNCDIISANGQGRTGGHSGFSIVCDGPSLVQNIRFEDIRIENQIEYKNLELIVTEGRRYGTAGPGNIKGVYLKNIRWANANKPFVIAGIPTNLIEDITFDHCFLAGKPLSGINDGDFQIEFAKDIKFIAGKNTQQVISKE
ncbi:glycosyl hydrolase family 28 protein [uncultured Mucilaginibacter sp.]|uniref:glycosyl hydrolase family 28 protein n=1 Tax=uncultured Mucilaginibacter sp. TaxID=797541 RepID=UPI002632D18C|nr:glycosyl hydrolase family 28 protein [uncultured Mucilaginibacter sp.]